MSVSVVGDIDGVPVRAVSLSGGGLGATIMEWGCVMTDLRLDHVARPLILSYPDLAGYVRNGREHMGAIAGRVANRIRGGRFVLDGETFQLSRNVEGRDMLHGGDRGFGRSLWKLVDHGADHAAFIITQHDGAGGFPGTVTATARYRLMDGAVEMRLAATTTAPTPVNLAQHNYYNLSGDARIDDHLLQINARRYTPLGPDMAPSGDVADVTGPLDFQTMRAVGDVSLDNNYCLATERRAVPVQAAVLQSRDVSLTIETTEPGVQVYSSEHLPTRPRAGLCLEAQSWPDAVNHPEFPDTILRPDQTYEQITILRLAHLQ